ncbi:hypothetical protein Deipe_0467 [Deinococcus peraridilitoris DSM 19664]|uniref:Uncharacterized protein n=2 Tax=Deinococcus TaxID=1298 RepID=K9ZWN8_DEIPD|nr:hypothetical protein Deipe_0467 [Deinococcus peraridilitoris DSM 19664]
MYLAPLPIFERRRHASNATIAWILSNQWAKEVKGTPEDFMPAFAQLEDAIGGHYPPDVARAIQIALRRKLITQDGLDHLDSDAVKASLNALRKEAL